MGQALAGQSFDQHRQRVLVDIARVIEGNAILRMLEGRYAAPDTDFEPPASHVVEHADLFDQAQWVVERQQVDQRAEPEITRALSSGGQKQIGRRRHPERRRVMLSDVVAPDARLLVGLDQPQTLLEELTRRAFAGGALDVVEDPDIDSFHWPVPPTASIAPSQAIANRQS